MTHLQREEQHRQLAVLGDIDRHAERERRLAHRRAGADDVQCGGLQPVEQLVEVRETRCGAGDGASTLVQVLEVVHHVGQDRVDRLCGIGDPALGHLEHFRLSPVQQTDHVFGLAVGHLGDLGRDSDEFAGKCRVLDDFCVPTSIGDRRCSPLQFDEVLRAAEFFEHARPTQFVCHGHDVNGLASRRKRADGVVDVLVRWFVELTRGESHLRDRVDGVARQ